MNMDSDYDILDCYLDSALSPEEMQTVATRLAAEPDLAAALEALRVQRATRQAAWQSYEPDDAAAKRFAAQTIRSLRRERLLSMAAHATRLAASVAACLALGVSMGWVLWGKPVGLVPTSTTSGPTASLTSTSNHNSGAGTYQVAITDENGKVVAVQKFNGFDEAKAFADDLGRYQQRRLDVQDGKATVVSDKF